jgi:hypothetical protein
VSHLPNYLGHIPKVISNHKKKIHAQGHAREIQNDLLLTQRGLDCVYGYAGVLKTNFECNFYLLFAVL